MNNPNDLPGYLLPWVGVIPMHELQAGAQAAREHQQMYQTQEDRAGEGQGHQAHPPGQAEHGQQDRGQDADTTGDGWGWG